MADLSYWAVAIAVLVFLTSIAHTYIRWVVDWRQWIWRSYFIIFLIGYFVAFAFWKKEKKDSVYLLVLELPGVYGLTTEFYICWHVLTIFRLSESDRKQHWLLGVATAIAIILHFLDLHLEILENAPIVIRVLIGGSGFFHALMAVALGISLHKEVARHRKFISITCSFLLAFIADISLTPLWPNKPFYCLVHGALEIAVILFVLLIRYSSSLATPVKNALQTSTDTSSAVLVGTQSLPRPASLQSGVKQRSSEGELARILEIFTIKKTENGGFVEALVVLVIEGQYVLRLMDIDWKALQDWEESVGKLIGEEAYQKAKQVLTRNDCNGQTIYTGCVLEDVIKDPQHSQVLLKGGFIPFRDDEA